MSDELKACPKCGNDKLIQTDRHTSVGEGTAWDSCASSMECSCGLKFSPYSCGSYNYDQRKINDVKTREAWNTRPIEDALRQRIKELEEELDAIKVADRKDTEMACHYYLKCQKLDAWQKEAVKSIKTLIGIVEGEWGDLALAAFHAEIEDNSNFLINVKKLIEQAEEHGK